VLDAVFSGEVGSAGMVLTGGLGWRAGAGADGAGAVGGTSNLRVVLAKALQRFVVSRPSLCRQACALLRLPVVAVERGRGVLGRQAMAPRRTHGLSVGGVWKGASCDSVSSTEWRPDLNFAASLVPLVVGAVALCTAALLLPVQLGRPPTTPKSTRLYKKARGRKPQNKMIVPRLGSIDVCLVLAVSRCSRVSRCRTTVKALWAPRYFRCGCRPFTLDH